MHRNLSFLSIPSLLLCLQSCSGRVGQQAKTEPPNVILILVDDMGPGDLGFLGQESFSTPHIDAMAAEGMYFSRMYTGSTVCAPSRAALMTGKHTGHSSVRGNQPEQLVGDNELTLATIFKNAGYVTGAIGKWGIGHPPPADDPAKKGFDYFYGYLNMWHAHNFYPEFLYENGEKVLLKNKTLSIDGKNPWADRPEGTGVAQVKEEYVHDLFDKKALSFLEKNKDVNFFLYLAYNVPHTNNEAGAYTGDGMEVPDYHEFAGMEWPVPEKGFAAMMRNLDNSVGMLLAKLKELGIDDKTMVMFCSDNGAHQEGGHKVEFFNSNSEFRGRKRDMYDGGIRTPFIVRWPGKVASGSVSDELFAFWDFLPTFAELTNAEKPAGTDGISFLPALLNYRQDKKHEYLYWEFYEHGGSQAILKDNWKAVRLNVSGEPENRKVELYDLNSDPGEQNNVAEKHPGLVKEFEKLFVSARTEFDVVPLFRDK